MKTLVVEDDICARLIILELLDGYGRVDTVSSGREAVALFASAVKHNEPYDLVCLDIMMPGMDGHEVLRKIRNLEAEQGIEGLDGTKVFMITALGDSSNVMNAFKAQCDGYLVKPVNQEKLVNLLREAGLVS